MSYTILSHDLNENFANTNPLHTAMALGVAIFSTGFNVQQSLKDLLSYVKNSMKHDVQVVLINQIPKEEALMHFSGIGNINRVETWNGGRGGMQSMVVSTDAGVGIISLPYNSYLPAFNSIKGSWLSSATEPGIVMNQEASALYDHPAIGSYHTLSFRGKQLKARLAGIVEEFEKPKIYIDQEQYDTVANPNLYVNRLMFVAEGMIVSVVSIFIGLLLSWPLSIDASRFFANLMLEVKLH